MRASIRRSLEGVLVAGVLTFSAVGAVTPTLALGGGHGGSGGRQFFLGITGCCDNGPTQGSGGGFEAHDAAAARPSDGYRHGVRRRELSCNPYLTHPLPAYCPNQ